MMQLLLDSAEYARRRCADADQVHTATLFR
jgi:hypothetical protein